MRVKTAAKINLALDVTGKLPNGYHDLESVFQTVGLYDEVEVELTNSGIELSCDVPDEFASSDPIPCDERNIAYKAAKFFFEQNGMDCGCRIHIKKGIPSQAGMGGGSTDAAAVLYCLGRMTGKTISNSEKLGADVPFFLTGGTAYVEGIGEKITPIADYSGRILVIAKGKEGVSTAEAYRNIDSLTAPAHPETHKLAEAINCNPKYISEIESRNKFPSPETIDAVASALNITITQLFEEQGSPMNAAAFNKTKFAEELTTELHNRMKQDILDFLDKKIK